MENLCMIKGKKMLNKEKSAFHVTLLKFHMPEKYVNEWQNPWCWGHKWDIQQSEKHI